MPSGAIDILRDHAAHVSLVRQGSETEYTGYLLANLETTILAAGSETIAVCPPVIIALEQIDVLMNGLGGARDKNRAELKSLGRIAT